MPQDASACVVLRGQTRENAVSVDRLASLGITAKSWADDISSQALPGHVCWAGEHMAGYCFGSAKGGEIVVLAVLPQFECQGMGKALLMAMCNDLVALGHRRLFLGCAADPASRSHGFYRHLGWQPTGQVDRLGDEVLEWFPRLT